MSRIVDWISRLWEHLVADYQKKLEVHESSHYFHHAIDSLLIVLGAWLLIRILRYFVLRFERRVDRIHGAGYRRRIETITSLTRSIFSLLCLHRLRILDSDRVGRQHRFAAGWDGGHRRGDRIRRAGHRAGRDHGAVDAGGRSALGG